MNDALKNFTTDELLKEIAQREEEERAKEKQRRIRVGGLLRFWSDKNRDSVMYLCPEHERTSCSDSNPINRLNGCSRCALLSLLQHEVILTDLKPVLIFIKDNEKDNKTKA